MSKTKFANHQVKLTAWAKTPGPIQLIICPESPKQQESGLDEFVELAGKHSVTATKNVPKFITEVEVLDSSFLYDDSCFLFQENPNPSRNRTDSIWVRNNRDRFINLKTKFQIPYKITDGALKVDEKEYRDTLKRVTDRYNAGNNFKGIVDNTVQRKIKRDRREEDSSDKSSEEKTTLTADDPYIKYVLRECAWTLCLRGRTTTDSEYNKANKYVTEHPQEFGHNENEIPDFLAHEIVLKPSPEVKIMNPGTPQQTPADLKKATTPRTDSPPQQRNPSPPKSEDPQVEAVKALQKTFELALPKLDGSQAFLALKDTQAGIVQVLNGKPVTKSNSNDNLVGTQTGAPLPLNLSRDTSGGSNGGSNEGKSTPPTSEPNRVSPIRRQVGGATPYQLPVIEMPLGANSNLSPAALPSDGVANPGPLPDADLIVRGSNDAKHHTRSNSQEPQRSSGIAELPNYRSTSDPGQQELEIDVSKNKTGSPQDGSPPGGRKTVAFSLGAGNQVGKRLSPPQAGNLSAVAATGITFKGSPKQSDNLSNPGEMKLPASAHSVMRGTGTGKSSYRAKSPPSVDAANASDHKNPPRNQRSGLSASAPAGTAAIIAKRSGPVINAGRKSHSARTPTGRHGVHARGESVGTSVLVKKP